MWNLPNLFSFLRIPLAFLFFQQNGAIRALGILLALITDGLDGHFARRFKQTTRFGTLLDPLTDRFFVILAVSVLAYEEHLAVWKILSLFARDGAIALFGLFLWMQGLLGGYSLRAIWCGKITTVLQLTVLFGMTLGFSIPDWMFFFFYALGLLAFVELYFSPMTSPDRP